jgi:ribosome-associated toxin RatA of RatAB toxin-antitoxin module
MLGLLLMKSCGILVSSECATLGCQSNKFCHAGPTDVEPRGKEGDVEIRRSVLVPYPADAMFDLIERAEDYPSFLPWCTAAQILERSDERVDARLEFTYLSLSFAVLTSNPKRRPEWLQVRMVEGPFSRFHGDWRLVPLADRGCKVMFDFSCLPTAGLLDRLAKSALERIFGSVVDAFVKRAESTLTPLDAAPRPDPVPPPSALHG